MIEFDSIIETLANDESVSVANGEVLITRKLKCLIGNIPVYNILLKVLNESGTEYDLFEFEDFTELNEFSIINEQGVSMDRCILCGGLPEEGYYKDNETGNEFCSYACVVKWFNELYGQGNWKPASMMLNGFEGLNKDKFLIRDVETDTWREYDIQYICPKNCINAEEIGLGESFLNNIE